MGGFNDMETEEHFAATAAVGSKNFQQKQITGASGSSRGLRGMHDLIL